MAKSHTVYIMQQSTETLRQLISYIVPYFLFFYIILRRKKKFINPKVDLASRKKKWAVTLDHSEYNLIFNTF